jgi:hypothetical protein
MNDDTIQFIEKYINYQSYREWKVINLKYKEIKKIPDDVLIFLYIKKTPI